jgi:hypothetical protein
MKRERKEVAENGQHFPTPSQRRAKRSSAGGRGIGPPQESTSDSGSTQAAQSQRQLGVRRTSRTARHRARHVQSDCRPVEQPSSPAVLTKREETAVPTSLQYPLERERALERRWHRLLQRTVAPKKDLRQTGGLRPHHAVPQALPSSPPGRRQLRAERRGCVRAFSASTTQSCSDPAKAINRLDRPLSARAWSRSHQG